MRQPLKLATLLVVALAFSACTDSPQRTLTEPGGLRLQHTALTTAMDALFHDIDDALNTLYVCAGSKNIENKNSDLDKVRKYAEAGWWTAADNPDDGTGLLNVAYMVQKIIDNTDGLIAKKKDNIPSSCSGYYANATERDQIKSELFFLLRVFENQGDYEQGDVSATSCTATEDCEETGNGWKFFIPADAFPYDVIVVVKPNNGPPPQDFTKAPNSASYHFDVFPPGAANSPWTRYICWEGTNDQNEPDEDWVVMVREAGNGELDYLPTTWEPWEGATCTQQVAMNKILKGIHNFFAGLPFLPRDANAYSPPRTFGGTSPLASPHWLTVVVPVPGYTLAQLVSLTDEYYGENIPNKNAAMGKLEAAAACAAEDDACWNEALAGFISNVKAQTQPPANKILTADQGAELMGIALALMR